MSCSVQIKSRNTVKMKKVNNVVHRTTSETLRLSEPEVLMNNTSRQALSAISPPILKKSSCSFQITGVSLTQRADLGDDSADDLDESHTDDISRVTDNETPSFSEDTCSRDTEDNIIDSCSALCSVTVIPTVSEFELENILSTKTSFITTAEFSENSIDHLTIMADMASNPPTTTKNQRFPGTRFTVVKIETGVPVRRGRWECLDYIDNSVYTPKHALTYNSPTTSDLSSTNTQPHYTMTPTTPTSKPMQGDFAVLGTNYIDTVNKLLQSLSPPIPGMKPVAPPIFPLESPLANQQLSPVSAVPPSLSSPTQQDYTAILTSLISAQLRKTTGTQQSTTLPLANLQLSPQILNQTTGCSSQDALRSLQLQPSVYSSTHGSVSTTQIQAQPLLQSFYSSPSLPVTSITMPTTLGSAQIQNQISLNRNMQSQSGLPQIQGQVQQQIYSSPTQGSGLGYMPQPLYSSNPQTSVSSSIPMVSYNQGSSTQIQRNVQFQPTIYSTTANQQQAPIQGQVQQQMMYSSPTQGLPPTYPIQSSTNRSTEYSAGISPTLYSTQSQPMVYNTAPAQGSVAITQYQGELKSIQPQASNYPVQSKVQDQSSQLYSTQPQIALQSLPSQPTSQSAAYSTQSQAPIDYITQAKQIILQLQNQSLMQNQSQMQHTAYSTTPGATSALQNPNQASLSSLGQGSSYMQQSQVQIPVTTYSAPQIQRQISAPSQLSNQSSTYLPQNLNTNYLTQASILTSSANLMSQVSSQPQVPSQSTSFVSLPNQTNITSLPPQTTTNYLFQTSAGSQNYLPAVQNQSSNYAVTQPFTYPTTNSNSYVSQTSVPNQAGSYAPSVQQQSAGYPLQNTSQQSGNFQRSQLVDQSHNYFVRPQSHITDHLSEPYFSTQLRNYSSNIDNILQTSCSVIQLHKQGQPASYVALPQDHGAYVLHHVPSLSLAPSRKSASAHQSRFHTQTSIHSYSPYTEKSPTTYVHQPGPAHDLTHQVPAQKRRLVGQTLNYSLDPESKLDSRSSVFSFHNRALSSTYSKLKDSTKPKIIPQKSIFPAHDSTTVTASIMKPIVAGSVTSLNVCEKSEAESNLLDKLKVLEISSYSSTSGAAQNLEQELETGANLEIAVMELKPAANNTSAIIDTKIEQAMDLVKSHLLYTVREEVEVLKLRISELLTRINQLEKENSFLKANATPEVLTALNTRSEEVQTDETSFSTGATPQRDASVPAVPTE